MSFEKFGRNYRLTIETNDGGFLIIEPPLTIEFDVKRSTNASLNSANIVIYNLSQKNRDRIFQDRFNPKDYKRIVLQVGYKDSLSTIFIGNIFQANSARSGTNILTTIEARDGGFDTSGAFTSKAIDGASKQDVLRALAGDFDKAKLGKVGNFKGEFKRPVVLDGNTFELMKKYSDGKVFIDLEQVNFLQDNEVIDGYLPLINSDSGLLETPKRDNAFLSIEMILEPRIIMGQLVEIQSSVNTKYDGQYKVIGVQHSGIISESVGGQARSKFDLLVGSQLFGGFNKV